MNLRLSAFKILWLSVFFIVLIVRFSFSPDQFADFESYVQLSDQLYSTEISQWIWLEPASNFILFFFRDITGNSLNAANLAHWYLSVVFLIGFAILCKQHVVNWQGVVLALGIYGSLLAFVTVRGTPAYILVVFATIQARGGQLRSVLTCIVAMTFHVSAILAIPAIVGCLAQQRIRICTRFFEQSFVCYLMILLIFLSSIFLQVHLMNSITWAIGLTGGDIEKYLTYVNDIEPTKSNSHLVYFVALSAFVLVSLKNKNKDVIALRAYVIISYFIFSLLGFAPVTAFRQSIFWTIPMLLLIPVSGFNNWLSSKMIIIIGIISLGFGLNGVFA